MGITKQDAQKALKNNDRIYAAYSQATNLPYVVCDEESYNDQAWLFDTEEALKAFGQKKLEDKILLTGVAFEKKNFAALYRTLHLIGVNSVVWNARGEQIEVELTEIEPAPDYSRLEAAKRPLINPTLQLCGIYLMQELRRPVKPEERGDVKEMEEELIVNVVKSQFLVPLVPNPKDPKHPGIPLIKSKDGKMLQPFFSDVMEFEKFARTQKQKFMMGKMPFPMIAANIMEETAGFVLNPFGFNMIMPKGQVKRLAKALRPVQRT